MRLPRLLTAFVVLGLAGCGGSDKKADPAPTPTASPAETASSTATPSFAEQANGICERFSIEGQRLGTPDLNDPESAAAYFRKTARLAQRQYDELAALEAPAEVAADYEDLLAASQGATGVLREMAAAAARGDGSAGTQLIEQLRDRSRDLDEAAGAVGARTCTSTG